MKYLSKSYIYISVYGDKFSPTEFSNLLGINSTDSGMKNEKRQSGAILKECFWAYQLAETNAMEGIDISLDKLLYLFKDKISIMNNFINNNKLKIKCYAVIKVQNNEDTGINLTPRFIQFMNELNASVEIDVYHINKL